MSDFLLERWRKPARILHVETDPGRVMELVGDPRQFRDVQMHMPAADIERLRQGRLCIQCAEPQQEAFPMHCSLCGFEIRDRQPWEFARSYQGEERLGSAETVDDEIAQMQERNDRAKHRAGSRIVVPGDSR